MAKIPELYYIEYDGCPVMLSSGKTAWHAIRHAKAALNNEFGSLPFGVKIGNFGVKTKTELINKLISSGIIEIKQVRTRPYSPGVTI